MDKKILLLLLAAVVMINATAVFSQFPHSDKFAHTFSIVARDARTGEMGVAVQSNWFSVGSIVSWAEAGVGAIATQSFVNVSFGPRGLKLLKQGKSAPEALKILLDSDEGRDVRQVAIIDAEGNIAAHTGSKCIAEAGHIVGNNFSVQANMMLKDSVWPAMADAFKKTKAPLAERMMAALKAAQKEGGDIRGQQSAAIIVVKGESTGKVWEDRMIDLRVEDHPQAVNEIKRTLKVYRAYEFMNAGDLALEKNDIPGALRAYRTAERMFPENLEMQYWHAVCLANTGSLDDALPMFKSIFAKNKNWRILTKRLPKSGLLTVQPVELKKILELK